MPLKQLFSQEILALQMEAMTDALTWSRENSLDLASRTLQQMDNESESLAEDEVVSF